MALKKIKTDSITDDAITAAKIDDDGTGFTFGDLTVTGTTTILSITQTDAQNLTGTYSAHEMIIGNTFTLTGDVTVNENIVLANFTKPGTDVTVQPDATERTINSTSGTGVLEGGSLMSQSTQLSQWLYEE